MVLETNHEHDGVVSENQFHNCGAPHCEREPVDLALVGHGNVPLL